MEMYERVVKPLLAVAVLTAAVSSCSGASQADLASASQSAAQAQAQKDAASQQAKTQASLKSEVERLKTEASKPTPAPKPAPSSTSTPSTSPSTAAPASPQTTSCGANVSVGANTTCAFANNVESDYYASGGGYQNLAVYSPVTGRYYSMTCTPGVPTVCRGGNHAVVYIR